MVRKIHNEDIVDKVNAPKVPHSLMNIMHPYLLT